MSEQISDEQMEQDLADCALDRIGAKTSLVRDNTEAEDIAQGNTMIAGSHRVPVYIGMIKALRDKLAARDKELAESKSLGKESGGKAGKP